MTTTNHTTYTHASIYVLTFSPARVAEAFFVSFPMRSTHV